MSGPDRPGDPASPEVRVVVVTYDPGATLERFLDTLEAAATAPVEVLLADNGSIDGAPQAAAAAGRARLVPTGGNVGYGAAANVGARGARAPWLLVANPDVEWTPGALDALLAAGGRWPAAGALGPRIEGPDGTRYPSARALPSLGRGIGHAALGWLWPTNPWTAAYRREREVPGEGPTGWLSGSCLLLRREAFEAVGGFDPGYFMFFEDLDLGERLAAAGWASVYVPSAVVVHLLGHARARAPRRMLAAHHRSAYRYLARRYAGPARLPLRALLGAGLAIRYLVALRSTRLAAGAPPAPAPSVAGAPPSAAAAPPTVVSGPASAVAGPTPGPPSPPPVTRPDPAAAR